MSLEFSIIMDIDAFEAVKGLAESEQENTKGSRKAGSMMSHHNFLHILFSPLRKDFDTKQSSTTTGGGGLF
jgi:hypothetical protein